MPIWELCLVCGHLSAHSAETEVELCAACGEPFSAVPGLPEWVRHHFSSATFSFVELQRLSSRYLLITAGCPDPGLRPWLFLERAALRVLPPPELAARVAATACLGCRRIGCQEVVPVQALPVHDPGVVYPVAAGTRCPERRASSARLSISALRDAPRICEAPSTVRGENMLGAAGVGGVLFVALLHVCARTVATAAVGGPVSVWLDVFLALLFYGFLGLPAWRLLIESRRMPFLCVDRGDVRWRDVFGRRGHTRIEDLLNATVTLESSGETPTEHFRIDLHTRREDVVIAAPDLSWLDPLVLFVPPEQRCLPSDAEL